MNSFYVFARNDMIILGLINNGEKAGKCYAVFVTISTGANEVIDSLQITLGSPMSYLRFLYAART